MVGWYFGEDFYRTLAEFEGIDIFVVSHQPKQTRFEQVLSGIPRLEIFWEKNVGYDWGAFYQFHRTGRWKAYDHIIFIHDDVRIKSSELVSQTLVMLEKHPVVGNGRVLPSKMQPLMAAESYVHARCKPKAPDIEHDAVRGSFFAVRRSVLELESCFEVFWDRFLITSSCGNWSTRASCARWESHFGPDCFGFLSVDYCGSPYLVEFVRGIENGSRHSETKGLHEWLLQKLWNRGYVRLCKRVMACHWKKQPSLFDRLFVLGMRPVIWLFGSDSSVK